MEDGKREEFGIGFVCVDLRSSAVSLRIVGQKKGNRRWTQKTQMKKDYNDPNHRPHCTPRPAGLVASEPQRWAREMMTKNKSVAVSIGKMLAVMVASLVGAFVFWLLFAFFLSDTVDIDAPRTHFDTVCDIVGCVGGVVIAFTGAVVFPIHMLRIIIIPPNQASHATSESAPGAASSAHEG